MKLALKIMGILITLGLLIFFALAFYVSNTIKNNMEHNKSINYNLIQNKSAFLDLQSNKKYELNLQDNDTLYYLHFWATYCAPCIEEFKQIEKNYNRIFTGKTKLLVISFEEKQKVNTFLKNKNYKLPFYTADSTQFFIKPNVSFLPTTIVVKNNQIIDKRIGKVMWNEVN